MCGADAVHAVGHAIRFEEIGASRLGLRILDLFSRGVDVLGAVGWRGSRVAGLLLLDVFVVDVEGFLDLRAESIVVGSARGN